MHESGCEAGPQGHVSQIEGRGLLWQGAPESKGHSLPAATKGQGCEEEGSVLGSNWPPPDLRVPAP